MRVCFVKRNLTIVTNIILSCVLVIVGIICFLPTAASPVQKLSDKVYYNGDRNSNKISLMFNVYWGTEFIDSILESLAQFEVKATFFIGGSWADKNVEMLQKIQKSGHELANHGFFHKDQDKLSYAQNVQEIESCGTLVEQITKVKLNLFAPPSGAYNENTIKACEALGYKMVMWSKDTIDWRDKDANLIYTRATKNAIGGDLVLMHPTKATAAALPNILKNYQSNQLKVVTVTENISGIVKT